MKNEITISELINSKFRNYAVHVIESRGIPNWYDMLTNVQRIIMDNTPLNYTKTLNVVGNCISNGYHSGDASIISAINKLARPFACSDNLLIGDGFFGTLNSPKAAAARYTSIKMNNKIKNIIDEYSMLNMYNEENNLEHYTVDIPIGLCTNIIGIAVAYKSNILPRNIDDIKKYLDGKSKNIKPYFKNFNGKFKNIKDDKTWLIEGITIIDDKNKIIQIESIPPILNYELFLKKLNIIISDINCKVENNSSDDINLLIKFNKKIDIHIWNTIKDKIEKLNKIIVKENIVLIKDKNVIVYNSITEYLDDFKKYRELIKLNKIKYNLSSSVENQNYLTCKLEYLKFMISSKRSEDEIFSFLNNFDKITSNKLINIKLKELNIDEISKIESLILEEIKLQNKFKIELNNQEEKVSLIKEETFFYKNNNIKNISYSEDDIKYLDDIEIYDYDQLEFNN